jgi:hypothetical protein
MQKERRRDRADGCEDGNRLGRGCGRGKDIGSGLRTVGSMGGWGMCTPWRLLGEKFAGELSDALYADGPNGLSPAWQSTFHWAAHRSQPRGSLRMTGHVPNAPDRRGTWTDRLLLLGIASLGFLLVPDIVDGMEVETLGDAISPLLPSAGVRPDARGSWSPSSASRTRGVFLPSQTGPPRSET